MKFSLISLFLGAAVAITATSKGDYQVFEKLSTAPSPWILKNDGHIDADNKFKLRIHLKNQNIASLHQKVLDISTPSHPSYGLHLGRLELRDMIAPAMESFDPVLEWIESQGLAEKSTVENDWIIVDGTTGDAEKLLQAEYHLYENIETRKVTARTLEYSIPADLHPHVDIIAPTINSQHQQLRGQRL